MLRDKKNLTGFSLVELIIYISIVAVVSLALIMFSLALSNSRQKAMAASETEANLKTVLDYLGTALRSARSLNEADSVWDNNQGRLALWLGPNNTKPVVFSLDEARRPQVQFNAEPAINLSSDSVWLPIFKFTKLSDSQISLELEMRFGQFTASSTPENTYVSSVKTTINLRQ